PTAAAGTRDRRTPKARNEMAAEEGKETRTGQWPALNVERVYSTTIPADELARALADHFRAQDFEAAVRRATRCLPGGDAGRVVGRLAALARLESRCGGRRRHDSAGGTFLVRLRAAHPAPARAGPRRVGDRRVATVAP